MLYYFASFFFSSDLQGGQSRGCLFYYSVHTDAYVIFSLATCTTREIERNIPSRSTSLFRQCSGKLNPSRRLDLFNMTGNYLVPEDQFPWLKGGRVRKKLRHKKRVQSVSWRQTARRPARHQSKSSQTYPLGQEPKGRPGTLCM
jgi:hypothetical protein